VLAALGRLDVIATQLEHASITLRDVVRLSRLDRAMVMLLGNLDDDTPVHNAWVRWLNYEAAEEIGRITLHRNVKAGAYLVSLTGHELRDVRIGDMSMSSSVTLDQDAAPFVHLHAAVPVGVDVCFRIDKPVHIRHGVARAMRELTQPDNGHSLDALAPV